MKEETKSLIYALYDVFFKYHSIVMVDTDINEINELWYHKIEYMKKSYISMGWASPQQMMDFYIDHYTRLVEYHEKFPPVIVSEENRRPGGRYLP